MPFSGTTVFFDAGLLTESEFVDLFGGSPKDIKGYKPISCKNEEGETRNFYVISLKGIDGDKILSMRRCRLSHEVTVEQSEFQLLATEQLTSQQGKDWFAFASRGHFEKVRPVRASGRSNLKSGADFFEIADRKERDRREELEESDASNDEQNALEEMDADAEEEKANEPKHVQVADASTMLGTTFAVPAEKPKKRRKIDREEDDLEGDMPEEAGSNASSQLAHLAKIDNEMYQVAKKHNALTQRPTPGCLFNLNVVAQVANPGKIGSILYGVRILIFESPSPVFGLLQR